MRILKPARPGRTARWLKVLLSSYMLPRESLAVLPENTYYLKFLTFFRGDVSLVSSVIVAAEEDPGS